MSEKDGWTGTGRREEEEEGSYGGVAGTMSGDWVNGDAAAGGGRADGPKVKTAGGWARPAGGTDAGLGDGAAADDDSVTGEVGGGLASATRYLATVEPTGTLVMAVLCDSNLEKETEADVWANGSCPSVNEDGALVSEVVRPGDLAPALAINSGYASSESGSCLTWPSLCPSP